MNYDAINGAFETLGAVAVWANVYRITRDRVVRGVNVGSMAFFAGWGVWNLVYYPHLAQWFSFGGGILLVAGNLIWLALVGRYLSRRPQESGPASNVEICAGSPLTESSGPVDSSLKSTQR